MCIVDIKQHKFSFYHFVFSVLKALFSLTNNLKIFSWFSALPDTIITLQHILVKGLFILR